MCEGIDGGGGSVLAGTPANNSHKSHSCERARADNNLAHDFVAQAPRLRSRSHEITRGEHARAPAIQRVRAPCKRERVCPVPSSHARTRTNNTHIHTLNLMASRDRGNAVRTRAAAVVCVCVRARQIDVCFFLLAFCVSAPRLCRGTS